MPSNFCNVMSYVTFRLNAFRSCGVVMLVIMATQVACETQPIFIPSDVAGEIGTIDDQMGNTYLIEEMIDGDIRVTAAGPGGDVVFTIDADGNLTNTMLPDGTEITFQQQPDGSVRVTGTVNFQGSLVPFDQTIDPDDLPDGKLIVRNQSTGAPFTVCAILDSFCNALDGLIESLLTEFLDELINANLGSIAEQFPLAAPFVSGSFPTGEDFVDEAIREFARAEIRAYVAPVQEFCARWQLLRLLEISPCDG